MPAVAGKAGSVKVGAAAVAQIEAWKMDLDGDMIDVTTLDSAGWKEYLAGLKGWAGSLDGNYDIAGDANGQQALYNAWLNGTTVALEVDLGDTGAHKFSGNAFIKKISPASAVKDKVKISFDFQGTAALTYA